MAFTDPQTVVLNGATKTLNRISADGYSAEYRTAEEDLTLRISHQPNTKTGRTRRMVRLDGRVVAADPLSSVQEYKELGVYVVVDEPEYGFSDTEIAYYTTALASWMSAANIAKLLSQQS